MTAAPHSAPVEYREHVTAPGWFNTFAQVLPIAPLVGLIAVFRDPTVGPGGRVLGAVSLLLAAVVLLGVARWFVALAVTVSAEALPGLLPADLVEQAAELVTSNGQGAALSLGLGLLGGARVHRPTSSPFVLLTTSSQRTASASDVLTGCHRPASW